MKIILVSCSFLIQAGGASAQEASSLVRFQDSGVVSDSRNRR